MEKALWAVCLFCAGCGVTLDAQQAKVDEAAMFQAVAERRQPEEFLYLYDEPEVYVVALGSVDIKEGQAQGEVVREAERACVARMEAQVRPRVAEVLKEYGRWFTPEERFPDSELVARLSAQVARASLKFWGRFYFTIGKYQMLRCVPRSQIEVDIIGDALVRERELGGSEIPVLLDRMERRQMDFLRVQRELNIRH